MSALTESTTEPVDRPAPPDTLPRRRQPLALRARLALALGLGALILVGWLASAPALWAIDLERAGRLLDQGMAWPEPRRYDSLPSASDPAALDRAIALLEDAARRRPQHPHAYRLIGQALAAQRDWIAAAQAYERALALEPGNPLLRWEASLVYSRMAQAGREAASQPLGDQFAAGQLSAPATLVRSLFCSERGAESCYLGRSAFSQPYAAEPRGPAVRMPVIFLHAPASLTISLAVPAGLSGLRFVAGLDPVARQWRSDGARLRVWAAPPGGERTLVADLALDAAAARRGWAPGWADLTPWAGQTIALTLETHPGPAGDSADDWYGWGNLALTTPAAAHASALLPHLRAAELRRSLQ